MKTLIAFVMMLNVHMLHAQPDSKLEQALIKNIRQMEDAKTAEDYQNAANAFERIAAAETTQWLPQYYAAQSNLLAGMRQETNDKKDAYYDKALAYISAADGVSPDNSEIYVLKSWALGMKIGIDPANRGRTMGMESGMLISRAVELDPENPRAHYIRGQSALYTPPQFGGGRDAALLHLETAVEKFRSFKPSSPAMPSWGEKQALDALEKCRNMK